MGYVSQSLVNAREHLRIADHILSITYPLVADNRLLLGSVENTFLAFTGGLSAILQLEKSNSRIHATSETFDEKIAFFKNHILPHYAGCGFKKDDATIMDEIKNLIILHKKSPLEFARKDKLVICTDSCVWQTLTPEKAKLYLRKAKIFIDNVQKVIAKNEGIVV